MQHQNNNNNVIADELNAIVANLSEELQLDNTRESMGVIEQKITHLDKLSQEMDIPELRALMHWMMLNIELDTDSDSESNNEDQIKTLLEDGSYYNWMDVLSQLLHDYEQSLLPVIYKTLTEPKWLAKPSAPLLRNLANWIETARVLKETTPNDINNYGEEAVADNNDTYLNINHEDNPVSSVLEVDNKYIFEEVENAVLEKDYDNNNAVKHFNENAESDNVKAQLITEKTDNYYDDLEEEIIVDPTEEIFSASKDISADEALPLEEILTDEIIFEDIASEYKTLASEDNLVEKEDVIVENKNEDDITLDTTTDSPEILASDDDEFSLEVDDIIMTLATISAESENPLDNTDQYIEELQRFDMLADISGYSEISPISNWCQQNISLFSKAQSSEANSSRLFVESGECWTWIELVKLAIADPEEISTISELNAELSRDEWIEPLDVEALQGLLLFLRNPKENKEDDSAVAIIENTDQTNTEAEVTTEESNTEGSEYSFAWDEDIHPELLEVYLEETTENITEIHVYLNNIDNNEASKEQRQDARRIAHTIKGGSAVVGITALSTFAYQLEKILDHAIDHKLSDEANSLLQEASSCVKALFESVKEKTEAPENFSEVLSKLMQYADSIEDLDDAPLELTAPVLPDFITQQNIASTTVEEDETVDIVVTPEVAKIEVAEEVILPTLSQNDELNDFTTELDDIVMTLVTTEVNHDKAPYQVDTYIKELQRLDMLSEITGFPEISKISHWYQNNLKLIAENSTKELHPFISTGESWTWIELVSVCLADPEDGSHLSTLSTELMRDEWVEALSIDDLQALLLVLKDPENRGVSQQESEEKVNETEAEDAVEIVDEIIDEEIIENTADETIKANNKPSSKKTNIITWDDDVHPELLAVYLQETDEQIVKIAALLHKISKGKANKEEQEHAARIAHTIKGASGVVGITEIVDLTHNLEDILDYAVNNKIPKKTAELLAESSDCLESLFEAVQEKAVVPEEYKPVLAKLIAYAASIENNETVSSKSVELEMPELPDFINSTDKNSDSNEDIDVSVNETIEITQKAIDASNATPTTKGKQDSSLEASVSNATGTHIRVPTELINKLLNLAGELVTASSQVSDKVEKTITTSVQIKEQDKRVHKMLDELSSTIIKQEKDQMTMLSSMQNKDFDTLEMDTYNELHSVAGLLTESILDSETIESTLKQQLNEIHDDLRTLDNLNKELSDTILDSRMESLNNLVPRLERIIRQTCRKTKKEAELVVTGNDINIDTDIITGLVDPLLHLLRNAVDHGIETPKARKSKKKKQAGQIHLNFSRQGNFIHMQLKDDGAGIDPEKIYQHAIKKGLITPDQEFSKSEVLKLILEPGFTTQKKVTDISGRGVGMDVVNKGIEALNGSLTIDSKLGKGTIFNVKIPLTLVTSSTLLVSVSGNQVAIPTDSIEQLYYLSPEDVLNRKGKQYIRHQGKELAIESLASILGWTASDVDFTKAQTLLLVKGSQQLHAVYIDQIIHSREVVIKSLAHFISGSNGVIGACHLSDGAVAPVMNLPQLLSLNEKSSYIVKQLDKTKIEVSTTNTVPQILVVDDSLSNRKALSLIIDKTEYDVITAVDGLDALSVMNEKHIDLVFTDLEMPRMTGLELTQAIRAWDEKKETPIVMVTSRSTNKHRELAKKAGVDDYLTKPVGTDTLLESIETWLKQDAIV